MLTALILVLVSAQPDTSVVVVTTAPPGLERVAATARTALASRLGLTEVDVEGHLRTQGAGCAEDARCLLATPALAGATRVLHLRLRPLPGGRLAADLRLLEREGGRVLGRHAAVVEPGGLATWAEAAAGRLFTQANPYAKQPPASPFAVQALPSDRPVASSPDAGTPGP